MQGYSRPWSRNELRQMKRKRNRMIVVCGLYTCLALAAVVGLFYLIYVLELR
jgi:hypothetical protein